MKCSTFFFSTTIAILLLSLSCTKKAQPELEKVFIPGGVFHVGSNDADEFSNLKKEFGMKDEFFLERERPIQKIEMEGFYIDKYEVTNRAYKLFTDNIGYPPPPTWNNGAVPDGLDMHPVTNITWYDAQQYCFAVGKRLPSEEEWEMAARGTQGNKYPWGNEFNIQNGNFDKGKTVPVGEMQNDKSVYGVRDMAGNVMEWTDSWLKPYPGLTLKSKNFGEVNKVLRGWSGTDEQHYNLANINARSSSRHFLEPDAISDDIGFRCAWNG